MTVDLIDLAALIGVLIGAMALICGSENGSKIGGSIALAGSVIAMALTRMH